MSGPMTTADDDEERQMPEVLRYTLAKEVAAHTNDQQSSETVFLTRSQQRIMDRALRKSVRIIAS